MIRTAPPSKISLKIIRRLNYARRKRYIPARGDQSSAITSGWVPPHLLFAQILNNRQSYHVQLAALRKNGLEDPFEITHEVKQHSMKIIEKFGDKTELGKAVVLLRSIILSNRRFMIGESFHYGLAIEEGGLNIRRSKDPNAPIRQIYGSPLPKTLLTAPPVLRSAACLEFSFLLTVLLRASGIKAHLEGQAEHVHVSALLDGKGHEIDAVFLEFKSAAFRETETDHKYTAVHYANKGSILLAQGQKEEALLSLHLALEIDPECGQAWHNLGVYHKRDGNPGLAMKCYEKALEIDPRNARAWRNVAVILFEQGKIEEAKEMIRTVIQIDPLLLDHKEFRNVLRSLDKPSELIP